MNTFEKIENAISTATVNGNFNSDLIEDKEIRRLALLTYINKTVKKNPESELRYYETADAFVYSQVGQYDHEQELLELSKVYERNQKEETQKAVKLDSSTIILGGKTALVIEKSNEYILGKFDNPTFSDKAYFTIGYFDDSYFGGRYDLSLVDATNDFVKRNQ